MTIWGEKFSNTETILDLSFMSPITGIISLGRKEKNNRVLSQLEVEEIAASLSSALQRIGYIDDMAEQNHYYGQVIDNSPAMRFVQLKDGSYRLVSRACRTVLGREISDFKEDGLTFDDLVEDKHFGDRYNLSSPPANREDRNSRYKMLWP